MSTPFSSHSKWFSLIQYDSSRVALGTLIFWWPLETALLTLVIKMSKAKKKSSKNRGMNEKRGPLPHSPRGHNISHHEMFVSFCSFFYHFFKSQILRCWTHSLLTWKTWKYFQYRLILSIKNTTLSVKTLFWEKKTKVDEDLLRNKFVLSTF